MIKGVAGVWLTHLNWWSLKLSAKSSEVGAYGDRLNTLLLHCDILASEDSRRKRKAGIKITSKDW